MPEEPFQGPRRHPPNDRASPTPFWTACTMSGSSSTSKIFNKLMATYRANRHLNVSYLDRVVAQSGVLGFRASVAKDTLHISSSLVHFTRTISLNRARRH